MTARINPTKARYYPEELPEAISVTPSTTGTSIASYSTFSPYIMSLKSLFTTQIPGVTLRVDNDSGHAILESPLTARPNTIFTEIDIVAQDSMDLWAVGPAIKNIRCAYTSRITLPTVFEKIKFGLTLSEKESQLASDFDLKRLYAAGTLGGKADKPQFKKIYEVAKEITVSAGSNTRVGRILNVKKGEKIVIIGIAVDSDKIHTEWEGAGKNDTFITLNRDRIDTSHVKLDCYAMPSLDIEIPCNIPAIDTHEIIVESVTGVTALPVRFRYGIANMSILEKIKWDQTISDDEKKIATEFDLFDKVEAGVL